MLEVDEDWIGGVILLGILDVVLDVYLVPSFTYPAILDSSLPTQLSFHALLGTDPIYLELLVIFDLESVRGPMMDIVLDLGHCLKLIGIVEFLPLFNRLLIGNQEPKMIDLGVVAIKVEPIYGVVLFQGLANLDAFFIGEVVPAKINMY